MINSFAFLISGEFFLFFFYYIKSDQFIISDNLFVVAQLLNSSYSETAFYETLFFTKPKNENTFFANISTTVREQSICLTYKSGQVYITPSNDLFRLLKEPSSANLAEKYNDIIKTVNNFKDAHISLSAGSDSNTLLSALLFNNSKPTFHSWGNKQYLELQLIKSNIDILGLDWSVTSFEGMYDNYRDKNNSNMFVTNGNNHTLHQAHFYADMPGINLFEGYMGSEFAKGELSDGMYTPVMRDILTGTRSMKKSIHHHYNELAPETYRKFEEYILDNYEKEITNINTDEGFENYQRHFFTFAPSKIFSPLALLALNKGINLYWPNLDIEFLRSVYSSGYGLMHMATLRKNYSEQNSLKPLYLLNRHFNSPLMSKPLDRNVAFCDVEKTKFRFKLQKRFNIVRNKIHNFNKELITDQVDYSQHSSYLSAFINDNSKDWMSGKLSCNPDQLNSFSVLRSVIHYGMLKQVQPRI